jgi:Protein of unknown function (DUF742)
MCQPASLRGSLVVRVKPACPTWSRVAARPAALLTPAQRAIAQAGRGVVSIAEIASLLDVPLTVARILVGDMADEGLVVVHQRTEPADRPDLDLLRRVLHGLKAIQ